MPTMRVLLPKTTGKQTQSRVVGKFATARK
jgi:hypothetical protein